MEEISTKTFFVFRKPQLKQVKLMLGSHEGLRQVKMTLIDFLVYWNDKEWVDWEKIDFILRDLNRVSFWKMLPYQKFLTEAEQKVSTEIMKTLRKYPY